LTLSISSLLVVAVLAARQLARVVRVVAVLADF
jgi:hypothetical protein